MGYRGRLIWPAQARIERLDTASTKENALAFQPSGYDRIFREPVRTADGTDSRVYMPAVAIPCQVRTEMAAFDRQFQMPGGRELEFRIMLTLHYKDLEVRGLIAPNGGCVFQPSDRLDSIYTADGACLQRSFADAPLFCTHVQDRSWGLSGLSRNLVMLYFNDRREGAT